MVTRLTMIGILTLVVGVAKVYAHAKTDVVHLYNGDRITGEIKQLNNGILSLSTDSMGTVSIEWQEIARVESKYYYEVQVSSGARHFGSMEPSEHPGQLLVEELGNDETIEWLDVVRIRPIESTFIDRIDAYFSAGYSFTKANDLTQTSVRGSLDYEDEKSMNGLDARANFTESDGDSSSSSRVDIDRAVWTSRRGVFRSVFGNYEQNDELDLNYRVGVGAGLGRLFIDTYRNRLAGVLGLQVITEDNKSRGEEQNVELYLSSRYEAWQFNTPELHLDFGLNLYPSITDSGRFRSSGDLTLRWEIIEDLFLDISAYGSYDNEADGDSGSDYGVTTGLGYDF